MRFWRILTKKKIVLRVIKQIFLLVLLAFGGFFMYPDPDFPNPDFPNPDFPNPIQIFLPNRIRTREKSPIWIRTKGPGSETLLQSKPVSQMREVNLLVKLSN